MDTERISPRYAGIDAWEPRDVLDAMLEGQFAAVAAVRAAVECLERAVLAMEARLRDGEGRLIYVGAGTSGRLAAQDGAELAPTFSWPAKRILVLIAGGPGALINPVEGAEDEAARSEGLIREHEAGPEDVVIGVAASGTTPFTVAAVREARRRGALTVAIANNSGTPLLEAAEIPILLQTGPEPIAGSTRLKAGTAQKVALNLISSALMVRLGRVYAGLMVDVQAGNDKLVRRSENMLVHLTGCSSAQAREALEKAGGSVKLAVLILEGHDAAGAAERLSRAGGRLRSALGPGQRTG